MTGQLRLEAVLRNEPLVGPQTVHFDLANNCNTRCTTCWHHSPLLEVVRRPDAAWRRRCLSLERFRAILDDLIALGGLEQIILSGMGEPTLNPQLHEMVQYAHRAGIAVTIITNLLQLDLPRLLDSEGKLDLLASLCAATDEVWQAFHCHPTPGGFARVTAQLELLQRRGFSPKHVHVINSQNCHQLVQMVELAQRYPVKRISFKLASLGRGTERVAPSLAQKRQLRQSLVPLASRSAEALGVTTDLDAFCSQIDLTSHRTAPIEEVGCYMGLLYCRVTVEAELLFCCNTNLTVGRIEPGTSFRELWQGERHRWLRDELRRGRFFAGCDQCGKYKENLNWARRLAGLGLQPAVPHERRPSREQA